MGKLLRTVDYILLTAAFAGDLFEETRAGWGIMPAAMENMYGFVPSRWKYTSYLSRVSNLLSTGDIKKIVDKRGRVYLQLSEGGKSKFKRRFPLFIQSRKWDGYFMIVAFDIPESSRNVRRSLRTKLDELGFGMLQKSVYISPYHFEEDMKEFLENRGLLDNVYVLAAKKLLIGNLRDFAQKVWKLNKINKKYLGVTEYILTKLKEGKFKKCAIRAKAVDLYLKVLVEDPILPDEFLPEDWGRTRALQAINSISE